MKRRVSIIIPALNEEGNIEATVSEVTKKMQGRMDDYEILLFNDGSTDDTGFIMDKLALQDPHIRVTHNRLPINLGGVYKQGVEMARFEYVMMVPGDNEASDITPIIDLMGKNDLIIPYVTNTEVRATGRRVGSKGYTWLINLIFSKNLKYYNGTTLLKTSDLRSITINTNSFAYQAEVLLKLLDQGKTYTEVGIQIQQPKNTISKALRCSNLFNILKTIINLVFEIKCAKN